MKSWYSGGLETVFSLMVPPTRQPDGQVRLIPTSQCRYTSIPEELQAQVSMKCETMKLPDGNPLKRVPELGGKSRYLTGSTLSDRHASKSERNSRKVGCIHHPQIQP